MTTFLQDLRLCLRAIRKNPGFTAIAVVTLALGIGANTAIYSVVHAVLLQPIPYPAEDPDRVLVLSEKSLNHEQMGVAYPDFKDWQELNRSFQSMAGYRNTTYNLTGPEEPTRVRVRMTTFGYFGILGVAPLQGRFFIAEENRPGAAGVVVLNYPLWQNRFGGNPGVIGKTIKLHDRIYSVIGVLPSGFELLNRERAYIPLEPWADNRSTQHRGNHQGIRVLARTRPGIPFDRAHSEMESIASQLEEQYPDTNTGIGVNVDRINDLRVEDYRATLWMLLGAVFLVLLIACTNVANLLLARAVTRRKEFAIKAALGAGRRRLIQQGLTEGVLLALLGGGLGVVLAFWSLSLLRGFLPADVPRLHQVQLDWQILGYTLGLSLLTGILFGLVPAVFASRAKPSDPLKEGNRSAGSRHSTGRYLLVSEVALATVLLIGAGLLVRSVYELTQVDPGFRADHILTMQIALPESRYTDEHIPLFLDQMQERMGAIPGVTSATVGASFPMIEWGWSSIFILDDRPVPPREKLPSSIFNPVDTDYFETFGIPLLRGRTFLDSDTARSPSVIVVNQALADRFWPNENPIGKRLKQGWPECEGERCPWREIVGVVGNTKHLGLDDETRAHTYIPLKQRPQSWVRVALRTEQDPMLLAQPAKAVVASMDPDLPVYEIETMEEVVATTMAPRWFTMLLLGIFAALAVVLAAIGLYGVIAYSVARRTQEIGLRMAVGAKRLDIFRLVVRQGLGLSLVGSLLGIAGALALSQLLSSLLYGVTPRDLLTFSVVPIVLTLVSFAACSVPAFSATRVDPITALRYQ